VDYVNEEITEIPDEGMVIIASGPLTSPKLMKALCDKFGDTHKNFFDAIAPIVNFETINMGVAFKADRYGEGAKGDYINCPMNKEEYLRFVKALLEAERIPISELEKASKKQFFNACQPVEVIGDSGIDSLRFGPMKPVGFTDPRTDKRPYAVVQLRQDNLLASLYNLVGFQTNLKFPEQERVFRLIPGLEKVEFVRFGQMHRNSYLNSPTLLKRTLQTQVDDRIFIAGQLTGVEGYTESAATGLLAGFNAARITLDKEPVFPPSKTIIGALLKYITFKGHKHFHPMNANFGLFEVEGKMKSIERRELIVKTARKKFREF
jgi:methylenetetrahydrofolate--tRNA-(uracil-5-)-methyltransferase